ncbi:LysE/ArgO family amino acid transporter [Propionivibrio sp.]|uniref:LysE/ArgO family amino acid transporter n=1 Tax=Propionivibrio sp. TaxID=2212460 RepID=UPI002629ABF4|nr:LysE/ArgO family amino acid transporter [Propionivibrio sp.]
MTADLIAGFLSGAILIFAIGAQNSFVLRQGIRREHVLPIVLVCSSVDAFLIAAGIAGLGALIESVPVVVDIARYGGAAFLFAYGIVAARRAWQPHQLKVDPGIGSSLGTAVATCLAFTLLNPLVYLDTVILLGSLANQRAGSGRWVFWGGSATASFAWFFALGYGARVFGPLFSKPIAWRVLDSLTSTIMAGLGLTLLAAR